MAGIETPGLLARLSAALAFLRLARYLIVINFILRVQEFRLTTLSDLVSLMIILQISLSQSVLSVSMCGVCTSSWSINITLRRGSRLTLSCSVYSPFSLFCLPST